MCPACGVGLTVIGEVNMVYPSMFSEGTLYDCENMHVWAQFDPPFVLDEEEE